MTDTDRALYGVLQELAGTDYASANYAGDIIESDMRRTARERGQALPTAGDVATETYHGAVVFDPVAGLHNHVSYPDYSALYPNIMRDLNASPETIAAVGDTDAFTSEHDVSEMQWSYIDTRPVKRLSEDETYSDYTDGEYKIVYDPSQNSIKWRDDWSRIQDNLERIYFVPHEAYEGLLASRADTYIRWNKSYDGTMYKATKRTRNCFSADTEVLTPNGIQNIRELDVGDRVYSIDPDTMAVELKPVTETHHYPDYDGDVLSFKNTYVDFQVTDNHRMLVRDEKKRRGYEFVEAGNLGHKHWSLPSGWDYGENCTTVDTVDLSQRFEEYQVLVEPSVHGHTFANRLGWYPRRTQSKKWDVSSGYVIDSDAFESHRETVMENAERIFIHKQAGDGWVPLRYDGDDVIELVGWYVTEGSLYHEEGGVEHDTATRGESYRFSIAQKNDSGRDTIRSLLERMGLPYSTSGNGFTLANRLWHDLLERWCGDGSHEKHLPPYVFAASRDQRQLLFDTMVTGDGDTRDSSYRYTTCSEQLRDDFMRLCVTLGRAPHYTYDSGSWRVFYSESKNTLRPRRDGDVTTVDDGVYCVTVADNHTLMAGRNGKFQFCGQSLYGVSGDSNFQLFDWRVAEAITIAGRLLLEYGADVLTERLQSAFDAEVYVTHGDTDGFGISVDDPTLDRRHVLPKVQDATAWLNETGMPEYVADTFGVPASETAHEVDLESYSPRLFIPDGDGDSGTKKTYAEHVTWDEGEECDEVSIKGFEAKRSDTANVTQAVQRDVLTAVLQHDPADAREIIEERVQDAVSSIESGDMSLADMGERSGMSSPPESYGSPDRSAHPTYRGAKYAKHHIDGEETFDKPLKFPVKEVRGAYPSRYDTDTGEDGTAVDYVSVEDPSNLPDEIVVDREQVVDSTLRQPLRRVLRTMGWSWSEIVDGEQQTNVTQFFQT